MSVLSFVPIYPSTLFFKESVFNSLRENPQLIDKDESEIGMQTH
jgi:hypothetical protein